MRGVGCCWCGEVAGWDKMEASERKKNGQTVLRAHTPESETVFCGEVENDTPRLSSSARRDSRPHPRLANGSIVVPIERK